MTKGNIDSFGFEKILVAVTHCGRKKNILRKEIINTLKLCPKHSKRYLYVELVTISYIFTIYNIEKISAHSKFIFKNYDAKNIVKK